MFEIKQNERKIMETKHNFSANLPILKNSPLFQGLSDGEILSVLPCVADKLLSVPDGQYVFRAGENISSMGLVLSGSLLNINHYEVEKETKNDSYHPGRCLGTPPYDTQNHCRRYFRGTLCRRAGYKIW